MFVVVVVVVVVGCIFLYSCDYMMSMCAPATSSSLLATVCCVLVLYSIYMHCYVDTTRSQLQLVVIAQPSHPLTSHTIS